MSTRHFCVIWSSSSPVGFLNFVFFRIILLHANSAKRYLSNYFFLPTDISLLSLDVDVILILNMFLNMSRVSILIYDIRPSCFY